MSATKILEKKSVVDGVREALAKARLVLEEHEIEGTPVVELKHSDWLNFKSAHIPDVEKLPDGSIRLAGGLVRPRLL